MCACEGASEECLCVCEDVCTCTSLIPTYVLDIDWIFNTL